MAAGRERSRMPGVVCLLSRDAVLVSALIAPHGAPARLLAGVRGGSLELVVSPHLLGELEGLLRREKLRRCVDLETVRDYLAMPRRAHSRAGRPRSQRAIVDLRDDGDISGEVMRRVELSFEESRLEFWRPWARSPCRGARKEGEKGGVQVLNVLVFTV